MSTSHFGKFYYRFKDEETSDGARLGETGFSDEDDPLYRVRVLHFGENADSGTVKRWYERQLLCSRFSEGCLKMGFLHLAEKRAVVSDYESDLRTWINGRYEKKSTKYWQEGNRWWINIREDFLKIFQPIFASLKKIHLMKGYHGNLNSRSSIKIQSCGPGQLNGILTDMQCQDIPDIEQMQRNDVQKLKAIICEVIYRPYGGQAAEKIKIDEVHELCFKQLDYFLGVGKPNYPKEIHELFLSHYDILSPSIRVMTAMTVERPTVTKEYIKKLIDSFMEEINI
ncbi:hypothetical protein AAHE18_06G261900 [Arachis hypogaea]